MIGAAASFKVSSRSGRQHEHESFNSRVVPASSRPGLGVIASAGFHSFDSGVETVPAPGLCAVFRGENEGVFHVPESDCSKFCAGSSASGGSARAIAGINQSFSGCSVDIEFDTSQASCPESRLLACFRR